MAVTSIDYELMTQDATVKSDGALELMVNARLEMEGGDGIITALSYPGLPQIGDTYSHFGEVSDATLEDAKAKIVTNTQSKVTAQVQLRYRKPPVSGGQNGSGNSSQNPEDTQPILTPGFRFLSSIVTSAIFRGYVDADGNDVDPGASIIVPNITRREPCNAAGVPYVPAVEETFAMPTLTLEKFYRQWDPWFDVAVQTSNNDPYTIIFPDETGVIVYENTFEPRTLLLNNITATQRQFGQQIWYWLKFEFWIGPTYRDLPNDGLSERESAFGSGPGLKPIRNEEGAELQQKVPLDVTGVALDTDADLIYTRWQTKNTSDFNLLGLTF